MPSLTYRSTMTAELGTDIHVTVYDEDGTRLDPGTDPVDWSDLADTTTVTPGSTDYAFSSTATGYDTVTATMGEATATFTLHWTPKILKFTSP